MRLTYNDRLNIERMLLKGYHKQIIADSIGCSLQTIYNEINKASYEHTTQDWLGHDHIERRYSPEIAEQIARENKKKHGRTAILAEDKALSHGKGITRAFRNAGGCSAALCPRGFCLL